MAKERENKQFPKTRASKNTRPVFLLIAAVLVVYFGIQVFSAFSGSIQTVTASHVVVNDSFSAVGWFFRDEVPISGSTGDSVKHTVYSGERVQKDAPLATVYADEQSLELSRQLDPLNNKIDLLNTALQSAGDGSDAAKLDQLITLSLQQMASQVKSGSGAALTSSADSLRSLSLRRESGSVDAAAIAAERDALTVQRDSLNQQLSGRTTQMSAPSSGYFSEIVDGYEDILTPEALESIETVDQFNELIRSGVVPAAGSALGKIIQGFSWFLVAEVPVEQTDRLEEGQSLRVGFTQASLETPVTVYSVVKERNSETALLVLEGTEFNGEMVSMREQPIEIILGTYTGLKVPKQAARMDVDEDGNSRLGVYILSGSIQKFKTINKLYETDTYYVVQQSATDSGALVAQDQIIIRGKDLQNNMVVKT